MTTESIRYELHNDDLVRLLSSVSRAPDSLILQSTINEAVRKFLNFPEHVFMIPLIPDTNEGLIQVINDRVLEKEIRFSVSG